MPGPSAQYNSNWTHPLRSPAIKLKMLIMTPFPLQLDSTVCQVSASGSDSSAVLVHHMYKLPPPPSFYLASLLYLCYISSFSSFTLFPSSPSSLPLLNQTLLCTVKKFIDMHSQRWMHSMHTHRNAFIVAQPCFQSLKANTYTHLEMDSVQSDKTYRQELTLNQSD